MKKVQRYILVFNADAGHHCKEIDELLSKGFELYGTPFMKGDIHYQAMLKFEEDTNLREKSLRIAELEQALRDIAPFHRLIRTEATNGKDR